MVLFAYITPYTILNCILKFVKDKATKLQNIFVSQCENHIHFKRNQKRQIRVNESPPLVIE